MSQEELDALKQKVSKGLEQTGVNEHELSSGRSHVHLQSPTMALLKNQGEDCQAPEPSLERQVAETQKRDREVEEGVS